MNALMEIARTGHSIRPRIKFLETDEGGKKKRTAMQRHRCFWIEGRGSRMTFGIINDADDGEVNGDEDGDEDIAKMHNERENGRKKFKKNARALAYMKKNL